MWRRLSSQQQLKLLFGTFVLFVSGVAAAGIIKYGGQTHQIVKFIGALVVLAILVTAFIRPQRALVAYAALSPLDMPSTLFGAKTRVADEILVAIAVVLGKWAFARPRAPLSIQIGLGCFVVGAWIASLGAINRNIAMGGAIRYTALAVIVLAGIRLVRDHGELPRQIAHAFIGASTVTAVLGIIQKHHGNAPFVGPPYLTGLPNSFLAYYTTYAAFIGMAAVVAIALIIHSRRRLRTQLVLVGCTGVLVYAVLTATSRGGVAVVGVGILAVAAARGTFGQRIGRLLAVAVLATAIFMVIPQSVKGPVVERITNSSLTSGEDAERHIFQQLGLSLAKSHPYGIGYGNFSYYQSYFVGDYTSGVFHAHETYEQIALDTGWIGFAGFAVVGVSAARNVARRRADPWTVAGGAALAGLALEGLNDYVFYDAALLTAVTLMLVMAFGHPRTRPSTSPTTSVEASSETPASDNRLPVGRTS